VPLSTASAAVFAWLAVSVVVAAESVLVAVVFVSLLHDAIRKPDKIITSLLKFIRDGLE
jgi:hypothetical protein